jgi:hypothetical protein
VGRRGAWCRREAQGGSDEGSPQRVRPDRDEVPDGERRRRHLLLWGLAMKERWLEASMAQRQGGGAPGR